MGKLVSRDLSTLGKRERALVEQQLTPGEQVRFCIVGNNGQAIVALTERMLVVKKGFMAGASFGGRATSFNYSDVGAVQVNTGLGQRDDRDPHGRAWRDESGRLLDH